MARSSINRLPEGARKSLHEWLGDFQQGAMTLDEVMERLSALLEFNGLTAKAPSRSAVHRYAQNFSAVSERVKRSQQFAEMLASEIGPQISDGKGLQVLIQAFQSLAYDMVGQMTEDQTLDPENLMFFARSIQAVAGAQKSDADRALKLRAEFAKEAAAKVETGMKARGMSAETIEAIKHLVLGV